MNLWRAPRLNRIPDLFLRHRDTTRSKERIEVITSSKEGDKASIGTRRMTLDLVVGMIHDIFMTKAIRRREWRIVSGW
jgi:hypothetical protein